MIRRACVNRKAVIFEHALIATEKVMSKPVKIYLDWAKSVDISTVESAVTRKTATAGLILISCKIHTVTKPPSAFARLVMSEGPKRYLISSWEEVTEFQT